MHALQSITHADGTHTFITYDSQGRVTNLHGDNNTGSVTYAYLAPAGYTARIDATAATSMVQYNENGEPTSVQDASGNNYQYLYNSEGQLSATFMPDGSIVDYGYDPLGNQASKVDALGNTISATYNPSSSALAGFRDANGNLTTYATDSHGNTTAITAADGSTTQSVPDPNGEIQQLINGNGQAIAYSYNSLGEVTREDFGNGVHTDFTYDARGNLLTAADASGTTTFKYDDSAYPDQVTSVTYPGGLFINYGYDSEGRLNRVNQNGYVVNYAYDSSGRLSSVTDSGGATIVGYQYNDADQVTRKDMGNSTYTDYTYTLTGQVATLINHAPDGTVNSQFTYTYDALGRVATMTTLQGTMTYGYDADSQLTSVTLPGGQAITYGYDAMGNRTTVNQNGVTTAYTTNDLNQYTTVGGNTYSYDKDGNLTVTTAAAGTTNYTYDALNRLIGVHTPTDSYTYTYDALGNLVASTHNGQTTQYLVDPRGDGTVLGEYDGSGNLIANYTYGEVRPGQSRRRVRHRRLLRFRRHRKYRRDQRADGAYVDSYSYLPFGEEIGSTGSVPNPFQYVGQDGVMTAGDGLDLMRARFYSPWTGRFIQRGPTGLNGGANLYAYTGNDPVNQVDPAGTGGYGFGYNFNGGNYVNASQGGTYEVNPGTLTSRAVSTNPGGPRPAPRPKGSRSGNSPRRRQRRGRSSSRIACTASKVPWKLAWRPSKLQRRPPRSLSTGSWGLQTPPSSLAMCTNITNS